MTWLIHHTMTPEIAAAALIFLAELVQVTISTIRIIFIARGKKLLAPLLAIFEITIWLFAMSQIFQNPRNVACYLAFAGGFTLGNFLGMLIETKLALGNLVVRVITHKDARVLAANLRLAKYGVTCLDGEGMTGPVRVVFSVIKRKHLQHVLAIIRDFERAGILLRGRGANGIAWRGAEVRG